MSEMSDVIPVDLDDGPGRELVNALTPVVRCADERHQVEGGGTRHWVRDYFLPELRASGWRIAPPLTEGTDHS